jgi:hypothetical protein
MILLKVVHTYQHSQTNEEAKQRLAEVFPSQAKKTYSQRARRRPNQRHWTWTRTLLRFSA